jgi:hypothetical protein
LRYVSPFDEGAGMKISPEREYSIRFDRDAGVIRITYVGILSDEAFALYREQFWVALDEARAITPAVRLLIDARPFESWPDDSPDRIAELSNALIAEDRIALIVRSSLVKVSAKRVAHAPTVQTFVSENAAWTWLLAYENPSSSAA